MEKQENGGAVSLLFHNLGCGGWLRLTCHNGFQPRGWRCLGHALADFAGLGVEADEELVGECNADDFGWFAGSTQALLEGNEVRLVATHHAGHDEQDFTYRRATSAHCTFALMLA